MEQDTLYEGLTPGNDSVVSYTEQEKLDQRFTPNVFRVFMLSFFFFALFFLCDNDIVLFMWIVMVCAVSSNLSFIFALLNILIGTSTRRNVQAWTNCKLHQICEPHDLDIFVVQRLGKS